MSVTAVGLALHVTGLAPRAKLVLIAIANSADEYTFQGHPSRRHLAETAECSVDTIDRCIRELVDAGLLAKTEREREGSKAQTSNDYRVFPAENPPSRKNAARSEPSRTDAEGGNAEMRLPQPHSYAAPPAAKDAAPKEPLSEPSMKEEEEEDRGRASDEVTPDMLEALKARAGKAINLASGNVHHAGALRQLMRAGCAWQDIEDATDAVAASITARNGRPFFSWGVIRESALSNRDRRLTELPQPETNDVIFGASRDFSGRAAAPARSQPRSAATIILERALSDDVGGGVGGEISPVRPDRWKANG